MDKKRLNKWLEEVAKKCDSYASKINLDFYVFQSAVPEKDVDLLILGINPGGNIPYDEAIAEKNKQEEYKNITGRTADMLAQGSNIYALDSNDKGNKAMRGKLARVFTTQKLESELKNATIANVYYFNTTNDSLLGNLSDDIKEYCEDKTKELVDILNPKHILFFCSDYSKYLRYIGVTDLKVLRNYVKKGSWNGREVLMIPNPGRGFEAFSHTNGPLMGEIIEKYLNDEDLSSYVVSEVKHIEKKVDEMLIPLESRLKELNLERYDTKRFRGLPHNLQVTFDKNQLLIRHIEYHGSKKYIGEAYPKTKEIRDIIASMGFINNSDAWLGVKKYDRNNDMIDCIVKDVEEIIEKLKRM